jgi:3-hydroxy-2-methylpyridine-4,5-dicarboxylate 4-decarboxylase
MEPREETHMTQAEGMKHVPKTAEEAIQQVVMANRILGNEGLLDALGHVSVRNPENAGIFFQARSISPFEVTREDILEIDLDGNVLTRTPMKPYGERIIHGAILKARPEMNAVFHGHIAAVIPFSVTNTPILPMTHMGGLVYQGVPIYDDYEPEGGMLIRTREEGERIAGHLGEHRVHLLRGHGCNIVAETLPRLVASAVYLRDNAAAQWQVILSGREPKCLSPKEAKSAMEIGLFGDSPIDRMWRYWIARVKRNMPDMKDWE